MTNFLHRRMIRFPDDIEQYLLDDQHHRAIHALAERRNIPADEAREYIGIWIFQRIAVNGQPEARSTPGLIARFATARRRVSRISSRLSQTVFLTGMTSRSPDHPHNERLSGYDAAGKERNPSIR